MLIGDVEESFVPGLGFGCSLGLVWWSSSVQLGIVFTQLGMGNKTFHPIGRLPPKGLRG